MQTNDTILFVANREVREVPLGWQHPRDANGRYIPLLPYDYSFDECEHTEEDERLGLCDHSDETMPAPVGEVGIAAYETTTEGTPISPVFPDTQEGRLALLQHCAEHASVWGYRKAGVEAWAAILFGEGAAVTAGGVVVAGD